MISSGIKASELIEKLQKLIEKHGDKEVYAGGTDYPDGVTGVSYNSTERPYHPAKTFTIHS